jgi:uncharacterized protein YbjT (DUF2867 family)
MRTKRKPVLVLGGTGKIGSRVAQRLWDGGARIRLGSRATEPRFDWQRPDTWAPALANAEAVYVSYYADLAAPAALPAIEAFADLAISRGVQRLVLLSARGVPGGERCEEAVRASGTDWTILRSSWLSQNFSEGTLRDAILEGVVALPVGDPAEPFVDADDVADVAAAALLDDRHAGQTYELTGPRLWSPADALEEIARACGRSIRLVRVSEQSYPTAFDGVRVRAERASLIAHPFGRLPERRISTVADGVERALGRGPLDFRYYVRNCAVRGVWTPRVQEHAPRRVAYA